MKSVDGGQTWTQLAANMFQNQGFARIAVVPGKNTGSDVLYAATMQAFISSATGVGAAPPPSTAGLFQSTNGGTTWKILSGTDELPIGKPGQADGTASEVVVNPKNSQKLYAGIIGETNGGIWQSDNGGMKWTRVPEMPDKVARVAISTSPDGKTLYAAITTLNAKDEANLTANFVTTNAGDNWQKVGLPAVIKTRKQKKNGEPLNRSGRLQPGDSVRPFQSINGVRGAGRNLQVDQWRQAMEFHRHRIACGFSCARL